MRNSYVKKNSFLRTKLHITIAFSNLMSNIISNMNDALFSEHCLRRSFKTIFCYLENDYSNLSKICINNTTNTENFFTPFNFFFQVNFFFFR